MARACIGLGANLGDPAAQIEAALAALAAQPGLRLVARSGLYRSAPIGSPGQPDYCNAAALVETLLPPTALLDQLIAIERAAGRERGGPKWGPRLLDLDLLDYDGMVLDVPGLHLPHRELARRNFVLVPLAEIAPERRIPGVGRVADAARAIGRDGLRHWDE